MKFCPKCQARLKIDSSDSEFVCPKCGYSEKGSKITKEVKNENISTTINVLDEKEKKEALPTIKIDCEKCGNNEAVWWMLQTRSADESMTTFITCTVCGHVIKY